MPKFQYQAKDKQGKVVKGIMNANDEDDLYRRLKEEDKYLIRTFNEMEERRSHYLPAMALAECNRGLGDMLGAGITLAKALSILAQEETRRASERAVLSQVLKLVRQGDALSDAMEQQRGAFPLLMINMYRAAETGGNLADTAKHLAVHYEKEHRLKSKIRGATVYPRILCVMLVVVVAFITGFIIPQFSSLFDNLSELPLPTRILFGINNFFQNQWKVFFLIVILILVLFIAISRITVIQMWKDKAKLKIPLIGRFFQMIYTARFARSLSALYGAGIPIITAIQVAEKTIGNKYIERQFDGVISQLREGKSLNEAVALVKGFRKKLSSVIRIGEESGNLVQMLDSMADSFDYESETAMSRMISYIEPALILVMAFIIGFIMISVMMPIYDSYTAIGSASYY